jgi:hypothetical protein
VWKQLNLLIVVCHNDPTDMALLVHLGYAEAEKDADDGKLRLHKDILLVDMYHQEDEHQGQETAHVCPSYTPSG